MQHSNKYAEADKCQTWLVLARGVCASVCVACVPCVSVSAAVKSCLECVHTCNQMNEAVGSELSGDIGSCQHCGVCDL